LSLPIAHVGGLSVVTRSLVARRAIVLFEPNRSLLGELDRLVACATEHSVTIASFVPTILERLLAPSVSFRPPPSLRAVLVGGSAIPRSLIARARAAGFPTMPTYGLTEVCAQAVTCPYSARLSPVAEGPELFPSGVPIPGVEARIVDGLIELRGDPLFSGYLGDPASNPRGGWLKTHDRGFFDEDGELTVSGRASDVIISGGENVDPLEVEAALSSLPGVLGAYVFGLPDATFGELVAALLVVGPEGPRNAESVSERLRGRLASYKLPRRVAVAPELPLTAAGKLDRQAARSLQSLAG
jgi:O-succinylbenzoic acid--CoA ligase